MDIKTINLHLFEEIQKTDTATLSVEMKTFYDTALIRLAKPKLLHDQFGKKQKIPKNRGKKIEWRTFTSLPKATTPITEGVTPDGSKIDASAIEATVSQYGDYIEYSDMLQHVCHTNRQNRHTRQHNKSAQPNIRLCRFRFV